MIDTIRWKEGWVELIDQTLLPGELVYKECRDVEVLAEAIESLRVRGAPAIGIAAAFGVALGAHEIRESNRKAFLRELEKKIQRLAATRPTAVNLFWALDRMRGVIEQCPAENVEELKSCLVDEALKIQEEDKAICRKMGYNGAELLEDGMTVLTHCNAGGLATADYGTALGVIYAAQEQGKKIRVFADETRPLLQGARLTAWELMKNGIETTLICDNMAAWVMSKGMLDCVIVGSDRIASNGDVANKIGTYGVAISGTLACVTGGESGIHFLPTQCDDITGIGEDDLDPDPDPGPTDTPQQLVRLSVHPNPFNPRTTVSFSIDSLVFSNDSTIFVNYFSQA